MSVTHDEVLRLAKLSALHLTDEEAKKLGDDLDAIVSYVWQLQEIDTEGVSPLLQPIPDSVSPLSEDVKPYEDSNSLLSTTEHQLHHRQIVIASNNIEEN